MSRQARKLSESGVYHVLFLGVSGQHIFEEERDYEKLRETIAALKTEHGFEIYAYCFMSNHVHLLIKENTQGDISLIMKRLLTKYARWYNIKYKRSGALIANRYKSLPVIFDEYFLSLVRYIHQNPIRAGITEKLEDYPWNSYNEYVTGQSEITDLNFVLGMMDKDEFVKFHAESTTEVFKVSDSVRKDDEEIRREILKLQNIEPKTIGGLPKNERNELLRALRKRYSIRQIERVTGVSKGVIERVEAEA